MLFIKAQFALNIRLKTVKPAVNCPTLNSWQHFSSADGRIGPAVR